MIGLESFKEYFKGYENQYVIIGGTACEQMLEINEYDFRVTKDIDMVLIIEALTKEFGEIFWNYIKEAEYKNILIKEPVKPNFIVSLNQNHLNFLQ